MSLSILSIIVLSLTLTYHGSEGSGVAGVSTTEQFTNNDVLDAEGNYLLFWNFNKTHITFEVHVKTRGWVGFGLSDNGNMFPADVIVGWVSDDGTTHFADRHTSGHRMPTRDRSQDWFLLHGAETDYGTVLKFVRKINTCDSEDKPIPKDTARLIFAYNDQDPHSDTSITYHGSTRGTKSVSLLSTSKRPTNFPADVKHYDFLNENYLMPADKTTYHCRGFQMPDIGKHHLIKFEPVITPGNELNVHHIVLYRCHGIDPAVSDGVNGNCFINRPNNLPYCDTVVLAWAIGGEPFYFPENVGMSVGASDDATFYIMETHYDNPTQRSGVIDNSGLRLTLTSTIRPEEGGMLMVGQSVTWTQFIPPGETHYVSPGTCRQTCLEEGFKQSNNSGVKVFAALQHAHLLGREIRTRHFRNGTELDPILDDRNYDFNFQEMRLLPTEVQLQSGDSLMVDCIYDSTGRTSTTFGGFSTMEEMCLTFLFYYPRIKLSQCTTSSSLSAFGVKDEATYNQMLPTLQGVDWTNQTEAAYYKQKMAESYTYANCIGDGYNELPFMSRYWMAQEPKQPYTYQPQTCT